MRFEPDATIATVPRGLRGTGPIVISGDDGLNRLLYLRDAWHLPISIDELAASAQKAGIRRPYSVLALEWLDEWRHTWRCNEVAQIAFRQGQFPEAFPDPLHPEWFSFDGPAGLTFSTYLRWVERFPAGDALVLRDPALLNSAEEAADRGLLSVYVVPLLDHWVMRTGRILGVSTETFTSDSALLEAFVGY